MHDIPALKLPDFLHFDVYLFGRHHVMSFDVLVAYLDGSNTLGHLTGYILTSQPLTKGGLSPYDIVPTCFLQSADHLFHDEVRFMLKLV